MRYQRPKRKFKWKNQNKLKKWKKLNKRKLRLSRRRILIRQPRNLLKLKLRKRVEMRK